MNATSVLAVLARTHPSLSTRQGTDHRWSRSNAGDFGRPGSRVGDSDDIRAAGLTPPNPQTSPSAISQEQQLLREEIVALRREVHDAVSQLSGRSSAFHVHLDVASLSGGGSAAESAASARIDLLLLRLAAVASGAISFDDVTSSSGGEGDAVTMLDLTSEPRPAAQATRR